ncbi:SnoaL-like protein [Geodermatophilus tzadiensis]|uniref:SnoaL-like protein n=1 Tax=Geodermatophilus tzadiensis TaxID=1137988 RepID=A0A2T0U001_9ACTN|nr:nuclear transport factor 2 family protein [Geodermatophilus tzadiensis]PRY51256.1 SnoaL-like protein [Geodermatophilus tzadiensis]
MTGALAVVEAWLAAVDRADVDAVTVLSAPDLEVAGPRGSVRGREVLGPWLARAGLTTRPLRWFCGAGGAVVVEQDATWTDPDTGAERGRAVVASRFTVAGGVVTAVERHDAGLPAALAAAGLGPADEVTARGA